jgi:hypothetical protein
VRIRAALILILVSAACAPRVSKRAPEPPEPAAPPVRLTRTTTQAAPPAEPEQIEIHWYGWQNAIVSGVAASTMLTGAFIDGQAGEGVVTAGLITFVFGPAVVHFAHGNIGEGFGSMLLLGLSPFLLGVTGTALGTIIDGRNRDSVVIPVFAVVGVIAGVIGGPLIDAGFLAYDEVPTDVGAAY